MLFSKATFLTAHGLKTVLWPFLRKWIWRFFLWFNIVSIALVLFFKWVPVPVTPFMLTRCVGQKFDGEEMKLSKKWVSFKKLSPKMQTAVVCAEDKNFLSHYGFDFGAIKEAIEYNASHKRTIGASTITQQTAKNLFLWEGRSWLRKGLEVYYTVLLELLWSKERIMTVYLNIIEFGDGIYGVEAASEYFYHKSQDKLTNLEAATLASILPSPLKWNPKSPHPRLSKKINRVMYYMRSTGNLKY